MHKIKPFYILLLLITFSFAFLVGGPMPYFLFYVSILSFIIPILHLLISFLGIKAQINLPEDSLYVGNQIDIEYEIKNKTILPIPIIRFSSDIRKQLGYNKPNFKTFSLGPRENVSIKEKTILRRRGFYENVDLKVYLSDIYSISTLKRNFNNKANLLVYPNIF